MWSPTFGTNALLLSIKHLIDWVLQPSVSSRVSVGTYTKLYKNFMIWHDIVRTRQMGIMQSESEFWIDLFYYNGEHTETETRTIRTIRIQYLWVI